MNKNENRFDWIKGFTVDFDLATGLSANAESSKRRLSGMRGMYFDGKAEEDLIRNGDPLVYEFYEMGAPKGREILLSAQVSHIPEKSGTNIS